MAESKRSDRPDERVWYDQFTSTDWVHDSIADAYRVKALRARKDFWGTAFLMFDGAQGWILSALAGFIIAVLAYAIDISEVRGSPGRLLPFAPSADPRHCSGPKQLC